MSSDAADDSRAKVKLSDEEFLQKLRVNPAYRHLDIDKELGKLDAWLLTPRGKGKTRTRGRIVAWLSRAADEQRALSPINGSSGTCTWLVKGDRRNTPCVQPVAPGQKLCSGHLEERQQIDALSN